MAVSAETGENDAGVAVMNAYNYIAGNKEPYDALAFLTDVYSRGESEEEDVTVEEVWEAFMENYGTDVTSGWTTCLERTEYDMGRQLAEEFVDRYC